jgi:hypothetical protein
MLKGLGKQNSTLKEVDYVHSLREGKPFALFSIHDILKELASDHSTLSLQLLTPDLALIPSD